MRGARLLRLAAAGFLLFAAGIAGSTTVEIGWLEAIPPEYHGRWNSDPKACAPFDGRGRIEISGQRLIVGGDAFKADCISLAEDGEGIFVSSHYVGPAASWRRYDFFALSKDRTGLVNDHAGRKLMRRRCR